jgi:hypothetical protein
VSRTTAAEAFVARGALADARPGAGRAPASVRRSYPTTFVSPPANLQVVVCASAHGMIVA